jgi:uncharacterized protein YjbI with pentapeptide repeats
LLSRVHGVVKELEPWGILLAVVGLTLTLTAFWFDYSDRVEERTVRAWQLLLTKAPGNSGKREALEYLNREDGVFCGEVGCLLALKARTPLVGIDLSAPDGGATAFLQQVRLPGADLKSANLSRANLSDAVLRDADLGSAKLIGANLNGANLMGANLRNADLSGSNLIGANLANTDLAGADLSGAYLLGANLSDAYLRGARNLTQQELDGACGKRVNLAPGMIISPCQ